MMTVAADALREELAEENPDAVFFDGLEDAILGVARQYTKPPLVVYDREGILRILMERDGMTLNEADEFCSFNIDCLWAGEGTPLILTR